MDKTPLRVTAADYAQLQETLQPTELIDGEIVMAPAPNIIIKKSPLILFDFL